MVLELFHLILQTGPRRDPWDKPKVSVAYTGGIIGTIEGGGLGGCF